MKNVILILISIVFNNTLLSQSSNCIGAEPFCTGTTVNFPASTNSTGNFPPNVFFDCLGTQPNPAFYYLQIDQPGNITITMQSNPLVDIDFICWGPFNDPNTMCDSLTAAYVEDCSYSIAAVETCDIINAVSGQFYILLITNYSNVTCNIDFSQTGGTGTTDCCILGDAGEDNISPGYSVCADDQNFDLVNQLNGSPGTGGIWYDNNWNVVSNTFDPSTNNSGTYAYIVAGTPPPGTTITCPDDTSLLAVTVNPLPNINFPTIDDICTNEPPLNLNTATPSGGDYTGTGISNNIFTPSSSNIGNNLISYNFTDLNGCSNIETQNIQVNEAPTMSLGSDEEIPCKTTITIIPDVNGGSTPYYYLWSDGSTNSELVTGGAIVSLTLSDNNGCTVFDEVVITQEETPNITISGGGNICNDGSTASINFNFSGLIPWDLTYSNGNITNTINNINTTNYSISTFEAGEYNVVLANDTNLCEADIIGSNVTVSVLPLPQPNINPSFYEIYPGEEITLSAGSYAYYSWYNIEDTVNNISENKELIVDSSINVYLIVESENGCTGISNQVTVNYIPRVDFFIPSAFTPNGDEHNDLLVTVGNKIQSFKMIITNRWGEIVFATNNINKFWDGKFKGKATPEGTYGYQVNIIGEDGRPFLKTGSVNVLY